MNTVNAQSLYDQLLGTSYPSVKTVAKNIEYVKHLSYHLAEVYRLSQSADAIDILAPLSDIMLDLPEVLELQEILSQVGSAVANSPVLATGSPIGATLANRFAIRIHGVDHGLVADGASHPIQAVCPTIEDAYIRWPLMPRTQTIEGTITQGTYEQLKDDFVACSLLTVTGATTRAGVITPLPEQSKLTGTGLPAGVKIIRMISGNGNPGSVYRITTTPSRITQNYDAEPPQLMKLTDEQDWAALQHLRYAMERRGTPASASVCAELGDGIGVVNRTVDWTMMRSRGFFFDGTGFMVEGNITDINTPIIDAMGFREQNIIQLNITGKTPCQAGLLIGRHGNADYVGIQASPGNAFTKMKITGDFTLGAMYNFASELCPFDHCSFGNTRANAHAYIADGIYHWMVKSQFCEIDAKQYVEQAFTINTHKQCEWTCNGPQSDGITTSPLWLSGTKGHIYEGYLSANTGGEKCAATTLYSQAPKDENSNLTLHIHSEGMGGDTDPDSGPAADGIKLKHNVFFAGANTTQRYFNLRISDVTGGQVAFGRDNTAIKVELNGAKIHFGKQGTQNRIAFDDPSAYYVTGETVIDREVADGFWNLPDTNFSGSFSDMTKKGDNTTAVRNKWNGPAFSMQTWAGGAAETIGRSTTRFHFNSAAIVPGEVVLTLPGQHNDSYKIFHGHTVEIVNDGEAVEALKFSPVLVSGWPYRDTGHNNTGVLPKGARLILRWDEINYPTGGTDSNGRWFTTLILPNGVIWHDPASGPLTVPAGTTIVRLKPSVTGTQTINLPTDSTYADLTIVNVGTAEITGITFGSTVTGWTNGKKLPINTSIVIYKNPQVLSGTTNNSWKLSVPAPWVTEASLSAWTATLQTSATSPVVLTTGMWWKNNGVPTQV